MLLFLRILAHDSKKSFIPMVEQKLHVFENNSEPHI